jgi:hypothetical protein
MTNPVTHSMTTHPPRDVDMVKFLVTAGADIKARAWGTFFAPGGQM